MLRTRLAKNTGRDRRVHNTQTDPAVRTSARY